MCECECEVSGKCLLFWLFDLYTYMFVLEFVHVDNKCLKLLFFRFVCSTMLQVTHLEASTEQPIYLA